MYINSQSCCRGAACWGGLAPRTSSGDTASLGNLAGALQRRGELECSAELYRQALAMREELFGPSHPRVAQIDAGLLNQAEISLVDQRGGVEAGL